MEDRKLEQQVWQRVRPAGEAAPGHDLRQLQREAMELAAAYRALMAQFTGRQQELARRLYLGEKSNSAVLAGVGSLSGQPAEALKLWQPGKEPVGKLLERCYHRTRRCATEYLARSVDGEFGVVYERMAKRAGEHCLMLARLLGGMQ